MGLLTEIVENEGEFCFRFRNRSFYFDHIKFVILDIQMNA